jgi:6-pyruvoyltetrahydropterin/6-carboxytetrahydropterin synthase
MLRITKEFHFSASHVLDRLPSWHSCARMHGHNYVVVLELSARREDLTEAGFVRDYRELDAFKKWMDDTLDHRHLNEAMGGYLSVGRESGRMDLRPLDRPIPGADRGQGLGDAQDVG